MNKRLLIGAILVAGQVSVALAAPPTLVSPDDSIAVSIEGDASRFSITRRP